MDTQKPQRIVDACFVEALCAIAQCDAATQAGYAAVTADIAALVASDPTDPPSVAGEYIISLYTPVQPTDDNPNPPPPPTIDTSKETDDWIALIGAAMAMIVDGAVPAGTTLAQLQAAAGWT